MAFDQAVKTELLAFLVTREAAQAHPSSAFQTAARGGQHAAEKPAETAIRLHLSAQQ